MNYHNITVDDMLNGDGLRVVLWVAGCSHLCPGCHNPITWDPDGGIPFGREAVNELYTKLYPDYISGLTFSGGDPLHFANRDVVLRLSKVLKYLMPNKTIWLYTGYLWEDIKDLPGIEYIDVIVDGRFVEELKDIRYPWAGSTNQRVIDVKKTIETGEVVLWPCSK